MGNSVTVIKVHLGDGVSYYKPPVHVMDILTEHPDYVLVAMSKGKQNILSSDVNLQPGRNYYLVSPDDLFSANSHVHIPTDNPLSCCSQGCGKLYRVVAIYFGSTKSLFGRLLPHRKRSKTNSTVVKRNLGAGCRQLVCKRSVTIKGNAVTQKPKLVVTDAPPPPSVGAFILSGRSSLEYEQPEMCSPISAMTACSSPEFLPLGHGMVARVEEKNSRKRFTSRFAATAGSESESGKESSASCIPWKGLKRVDEGGVVQQQPGALSKEKWLDDMIRGADNQWKRNKFQQPCLIEHDEGNDLNEDCFEPNAWTLCLPSSRPLMLNSAQTKKDDLYLDYSQSMTPGSSFRSQDYSFDIGAVNHHDQPFFSYEDQGFQGVGTKMVAKKALQKDIQLTEQLVTDERDGDTKHPFWLKMDEIEHQFLTRLRSPESVSSPIEKNSSQKFPGNDASTRLNFSRVDRG
ncbi:unnamed protein product [Calypogeia fissa]